MGQAEELGGSKRPLRYFAKQNSFLSQIFASSEKFSSSATCGVASRCEGNFSRAKTSPNSISFPKFSYCLVGSYASLFPKIIKDRCLRLAVQRERLKLSISFNFR